MIRRIVFYLLLGSTILLLWIVVPQVYYNASDVADTSSNKTVPLNDHGKTVYVTQVEKSLVSSVLLTSFVMTVVMGIYDRIVRSRAESKNARKIEDSDD
jgi:hypothetical protein